MWCLPRSRVHDARITKTRPVHDGTTISDSMMGDIHDCMTKMTVHLMTVRVSGDNEGTVNDLLTRRLMN